MTTVPDARVKDVSLSIKCRIDYLGFFDANTHASRRGAINRCLSTKYQFGEAAR